MLTFEPHPVLLPIAFLTEFPKPLAGLSGGETAGSTLTQWHAPEGDGGAPTPEPLRLGAEEREALRQQVRNLLRHGGHKPTGRGKPSCEYLAKARLEGRIPSINVAVDACNAASVHSGLPISVIDLERAEAPFRVATPPSGEYVFNASGQTIGLAGLLCLLDASGPIANAVKDSHGTKTTEATRRTLSVVWAPDSHRDHAQRATLWYRELLETSSGARTLPLEATMGSRAAETLLGVLQDLRGLPADRDSSVPVSITHHLQFPSPEAAALSSEAIEMMGFRLASGEGSLRLGVERSDEPNLPAIFRTVMHLKELVAPYDGDHLGWRPKNAGTIPDENDPRD